MTVQRTGLSSVAAVAALSVSPAVASTLTQITVTGEITQTVYTTGGHPGYFDDFNPDDGYIFFDDHVQTLNDYGVWDQSQIPTSPDGLQCSSGGTNTGPDCSTVDFAVTSTGTLTGTWTFDADLLLGLDTSGPTGFVAGDGSIVPTLAGLSNEVSYFNVVSAGQQVVNAIGTSTTVFVANNIDLGPDMGTMDLIGLASQPVLDPSLTTSDGAILLLAGTSNWFEDAAGGIPDFSAVVAAQVLYEEQFWVDGVEAAYADVEGEVSILGVKQFGDADGSGEDSPLLPDGADPTGDGPPTFEFDLAGASADEDGFVFVDPEIAVGYTYAVVGAGTVDAFRAPTTAAVNDPDGYTVVLPDGTTFTVLPGGTVDFVAAGYAGVTTFDVTGISQDLMIDPSDTTTFVAGFLFSDADDQTRLTQTALTIDTDTPPVPLPASILMLLAGVGGLGLVGRRRAAA